MTYIELLNSFWDSTRFNPCSSNEAMMYMYLLHQCNIRRWINPFEFKTRDLELMLGLSRNSIGAIRNKLKQRGLLQFAKGRGSGSAVYLITGADVTNRRLYEEFCVNSEDTKVNTMVNTKVNTMVNTNCTQTQKTPYNIEDIKKKEIRHKKNDVKKGAVADAVAPKKNDRNFEKEITEIQSSASPPTRDEILEYFHQNAHEQLRDWQTSANLFFDSYNATGWIDNSGRRITNWQSAANKWIVYRLMQEKKQTQNETVQTDKHSQRRGIEPTNTSRKGFKGTF